jgi:hypothetical protein
MLRLAIKSWELSLQGMNFGFLQCASFVCRTWCANKMQNWDECLGCCVALFY